MDRRHFLSDMALLSLGASLPGFSMTKAAGPYSRYPAVNIKHPESEYPSDKRIPLGRKVFPVATGKETILKFATVPTDNKPLFLRLTAGIDFREEKTIELFFPKSREVFGQWLFRYAYPFQPFQLPIDNRYKRRTAEEGIGLRLTQGATDAWFYGPNNSSGFDAFCPQLLSEGVFRAEDVFFDNLFSLNSLSPFGWMGGCVIDGLYDLYLKGNQKAYNILVKQLSYFLDDNIGVRFENPHTIPMDGKFNSVEDFLPFAAIAPLYPDHIAVRQAIDSSLEKARSTSILTTEGCYTLAYPMARMAAVRNDSTLAETAVKQLQIRTERLVEEKAIFQRGNADGVKTFKNWGRGVAWYVLGMAKTLNTLEENGFSRLQGIPELKNTLSEVTAWIIPMQNPDGLWSNYIDTPSMSADTSSSAGIAAAIAFGVAKGYLPKVYFPHAEKTYRSLMKYVTCDGFITQSSQINRGGEELQRSTYRVITQFSMGLTAQLHVNLT